MSFFTVTWKIENFSMCLHRVEEFLNSPEFTMPEVSNVKWQLRLYPRGDQTKVDHASIYLYRSDQGQSSDIETFISCFIIVNSNSNLSIKYEENTFQVKKNGALGYRKFLSHEKLYNDVNGFLPNDILTVQVHICPKGKNNSPASPDLKKIFSLNSPKSKFTSEECFSSENGTKNVSLTHCSFTTRIPVERRILNWNIEELGAKRKSKAKISSSLKSEFHEGVKLLLECYAEGSEEENESLRIDILRKGIEFRRSFIKCEVSFYDSSDAVQPLKKSEHVFGEAYSRWSFSLIDNISASKDLIKNDSFKLKFDFRISYDPQNVKYLTRNEASYQNDLQEEVQKMLAYEDTSDVSFESKSEKKFPVHKFLICAKSSVFRTMFQSDTPEKKTGVIRMQDFDSTTVQHFKDYLYSDSLPDHLETDDILKLYPAAYKYQVKKLKDKCAAFLKNDISVDNVHEIIKVADMHNDHSLKSYAIDFSTAEMDFNSDVWIKFMEYNLALAAVTMRTCLVKMKKASKNCASLKYN